MAQIFTVDEDTFAHMAYSRQQPHVREFVASQMQQAATVMNSVGQVLFQNAQRAYEQAQFNPAIRLAQAALRQVQSLWGTNQIQALNECWQIQNAPQVMIPFLMANTSVRKLYNDQRCDGYSGRYFDLQPGTIGDTNLHWRAVNNGMLEMDEETGDWEAVTYSSSEDDLVDVQLSFDDQCDIRHTNKWVDHYIEEGRDPTSVWDSDLE